MSLPIKRVTIVRDHDVWLDVKNVIKEFPQEGGLIRLVENDKWTLVLRLRGVLKVLHVSSNYLTVRDEEALEWWNGNGE